MLSIRFQSQRQDTIGVQGPKEEWRARFEYIDTLFNECGSASDNVVLPHAFEFPFDCTSDTVDMKVITELLLNPVSALPTFKVENVAELYVAFLVALYMSPRHPDSFKRQFQDLYQTCIQQAESALSSTLATLLCSLRTIMQRACGKFPLRIKNTARSMVPISADTFAEMMKTVPPDVHTDLLEFVNAFNQSHGNTFVLPLRSFASCFNRKDAADTVPDVSKRFPILKQLRWTLQGSPSPCGVILAGGSLLTLVMHDMRDAPVSDLDFFIYGPTYEDRFSMFQQLVHDFKQALSTSTKTNDVHVIVDRQVFTFSVNGQKPLYQICLLDHPSPWSVVQSFDMDYCMVLYNGIDLYATPLAVRSWMHRTVFSYAPVTRLDRLYKALGKGFLIDRFPDPSLLLSSLAATSSTAQPAEPAEPTTTTKKRKLDATDETTTTTTTSKKRKLDATDETTNSTAPQTTADAVGSINTISEQKARLEMCPEVFIRLNRYYVPPCNEPATRSEYMVRRIFGPHASVIHQDKWDDVLIAHVQGQRSKADELGSIDSLPLPGFNGYPTKDALYRFPFKTTPQRFMLDTAALGNLSDFSTLHGDTCWSFRTPVCNNAMIRNAVREKGKEHPLLIRMTLDVDTNPEHRQFSQLMTHLRDLIEKEVNDQKLPYKLELKHRLRATRPASGPVNQVLCNVALTRSACYDVYSMSLLSKKDITDRFSEIQSYASVQLLGTFRGLTAAHGMHYPSMWAHRVLFL